MEPAVVSGLPVLRTMLEEDRPARGARTAMNRIVAKDMLASNVLRMVVEAPEIAKLLGIQCGKAG